MKRLFPSAVLVAAILGAGLAQAGDDNKIDLVSDGYVCDRADQVCYDQRGANVDVTRQKFGEYAASDVQKKLGKDGWGTQKFMLSNDVKCNVAKRVCKKDRGEGERAEKLTQHLFAAPAPAPAPVAQPR